MSSEQSRTQRELVFCHHCENEWYRDEHGLVCPECQSDIVEIIEADHDPRREMYEEQGEEQSDHFHTSGGTLFGTGMAGPNEVDPGGDNIRIFHTAAGPVIQRSFHSTTTTQGPDGGSRQNNPNAPIHEMISRIFQSIGGMTPDEAIRHGSQRNVESQQQQQQGSSVGSPPPVPHDTRPDMPSQQQRSDSNAPRFQFTGFQLGSVRGSVNVTSSSRVYSNGRLVHSTHTPTGGDQLMSDPDFTGILNSFFNPEAQNLAQGSQHITFDMPRADGAAMAGPIHTILASLGMMQGGDPGSARSGDYVFTEEALDRLMSHFMAQNQQSSAPGPANEDAIGSLPRVKVSKQMTGEERDAAECGICLTDCELGEDVAELPCKHWFHFECVKHWLESHDSCPTCRRGITPRDGDESRSRTTGEAPRNWQMPSLSRSNTHESMEGQQQTDGGEANRTNTASSAGGPGLSPQASRTHRWSRSRSPQNRSRTERSGLGTSVAEGIRNGILGWMGRHLSAPSQVGNGSPSTTGGSSDSSTRRQRHNSGNQRSPSSRRPDHHDLDSPEVD